MHTTALLVDDLGYLQCKQTGEAMGAIAQPSLDYARATLPC